MSNNYKKVITLQFDYSQMSSSVTEINRKMALLDSEFKLAQEQMKSYADETTKTEVEIQKLSEKIALQTQKVNLNKTAYDNAKNSGELTNKQLDSLRKQYIASETQLAKMNNSLSDAKSKLNDIKNPADKAGDALKKSGESAADMAGKLYIVQEALQLAKQALTSYVEFDVSMAKVKTIADTTVVSFKDLKNGVYDIARQTGQSAASIAEALNLCISSNVETKDALHVTLAAAKLAKAGFTDTATAVDTLTTIMNSYNMSADQATLISDKLIETQDKGKTTVGELGASFGKVAGLANNAGIALDEVLAAVATLTLTNGSASESLTSLKAAISNIIKPTAEAREIAKKLHLQFDSTSLSSKGLSGFLEMVSQKCNGNTETMAKLFGSTEALNAMLLLTGSGAESFSDNLQSIGNVSGKTEENLKNLDGTGDRFNKSMENMKTTLTKLGDAFSPVLEIVSKLFEALSNIPSPIYAIIGILGILALAITNITKIKVMWAGITSALTLVTGVFSGSIALTTANLVPFLLALTAIVAVVGLVIGGIKSIKSAMQDATSSTKNLMTSASDISGSLQQVSGKSNAIKNNASGTRNYSGGRTWVGENGPEIVTLPKGSTIHSNQESETMYGGTVNNYYVTIPASDIKEFNDIVRITQGQQQAFRRGVRANV